MEIQEGKAWKYLQENPESRNAKREYTEAFNALQAAQGRDISGFRCLACGVTQYGRQSGQPCGHCAQPLTRDYWRYLSEQVSEDLELQA